LLNYCLDEAVHKVKSDKSRKKKGRGFKGNCVLPSARGAFC